MVVVLSQEKLVLLDSSHLLLLLLFLLKLFIEQLLGRHASFFKEDFGLEPSIGDLQLALDLLPYEV